MKQTIIILFLFFSKFIYSQELIKIKIVDSEDGKPISKARIILLKDVLYSNDEGYVLVPSTANNFEITAYNYKTKSLKKINNLIELTPVYKNIDEVIISNIDIKKLFSEVLKNYKKKYYNETSVYDITYKQKNIDDDELSFLLISKGKMWTMSNMYNYKSAFNKNYDDFIQLEINDVKYFKNSISENEICRGQSLNQSRDFIGNLFFNYELNRVNDYFKIENAKYSGKIISQSGDEQNIIFKIDSPTIIVSGNLIYDKKEKVILHYQLDYDQTNYPSYKRKSKDGLEYDFKVGNGTIYFDFYRKDNKYIPSIAGTKGFSYCTINNMKHKNSFSRELIFNKFLESKFLELTNKVDLNKRIWSNLKTSVNKDDSTILLSEKEKEFINEKEYEK